MSSEKKKNRVNLKMILAVILLTVSCFILGIGLTHLIFKGKTPQSPETVTPVPEVTPDTRTDEVTLGLTPDQGNEYVDETLFLGDSNTVRFMLMADEEGNPYTDMYNTIAVVGMGAEGITTVPCEQFDFATVTMDTAVSCLQPRRIIMTFGTNNLDNEVDNTKEFIETYEAGIKAVQNAYPYADLIINSVPPCAKATHYVKVTIEQIRDYNKAIYQMCEKNGWKFLNTFETLCDSKTGYGKEGYFEADGIHLTNEGIDAVFQYIRTHAYLSEDRRPQEREEIPYIIGPLTEIYTVDPLSNQEFDPGILNPQQTVPEEAPAPQVPAAEEPQVTEAPVVTEQPAPAETPVSGDTGDQGDIELPEIPADPED